MKKNPDPEWILRDTPSLVWNVEEYVNRVLNEAAPGLDASVLLVTTRPTTGSASLSIAVEHGIIDPAFRAIESRADELTLEIAATSTFTSSLSKILDSDSRAHRSLGTAIFSFLSAQFAEVDEKCGTKTIIGDMVTIGSAHATLAIAFSSEAYNTFCQRRAISKSQAVRFEDSFLESLSMELLAIASDLLRSTEGDIRDIFASDPIAALRQTGAAMCKSYLSFFEAFESINSISSIPYEGRCAQGRLAILDLDYEELPSGRAIRFHSPVSMKKAGLARKVLEMCDSTSVCVACTLGYLSRIETFSDIEYEGRFYVVFQEMHKWSLCCGSTRIVDVALGVPRFPKVRLAEESFCNLVKERFSGDLACDPARLWKLVEAAMGQRHGTMIVISSAAAGEAIRLQKHGFRVHPVLELEGLLLGASQIDGAILVSVDAKCHAIGVILDGEAGEDGDPSRGARYNSALRHVRSAVAPHRGPAMCVVVSEDGHVDVVPKPALQARPERVQLALKLLSETGGRSYRHAAQATRACYCDFTQLALNEAPSLFSGRL